MVFSMYYAMQLLCKSFYIGFQFSFLAILKIVASSSLVFS